MERERLSRWRGKDWKARHTSEEEAGLPDKKQARGCYGAGLGLGWQAARSCRHRAPLLPALGPRAQRALREQERGAPRRRALGVQLRAYTHMQSARLWVQQAALGERSALHAGPGLQRFQGHQILPELEVLEKQ